ncbi:glycosyltransferase involved in cell wall biosynthesis [Anaerobacterium chartisolvens]|uniref:Glycosyltransferase involved in cell wall biosynthesis n=1 Tax=Anaerobacterium chartisolvens TaxID=1297424 RepID=A0A369BF19_9FIRM|nr:glycosyltransferase family 4 protein [Anaerobacterium chartisolvens]RCX20143.1 glycosyltransferase involved in cell wall biosynthesis [Anaerobacterium chartisolvens]
MRILMLSWEYPPRIVGGISRVVHDLAQELGEKGNEIHVVTCWEAGTEEMERDKNVFVHRVHTYDINTINFVDWVLQLNFSIIECSIRLITQYKDFDIIHAHDWIVAFAAKTLKNAYLIPMIATIHATEYGRNWGVHNDMQRYIHNVEWWLTYESWKIIVNSEYMSNEVKNIFELPEDKVRVIHNGVDPNKFKGFERDIAFRRNYASDNEKIVFFVGRLVNEKGAHVLIDAVPKIIGCYNDVKFVIAGKGPQSEYLKGKSAAMNINHKIYFTGYISDEYLCKLYKCADIAVFPSLYEPFGIVALEGMVANVPVVVSDTGGLGEIVYHGVDGMKSYTGNAESLADSILDILFNPEKAEEIKKRAMEKVYRVYNWDTISRQTLEVYREIIEESQKKSWEIQV